MNEKITNENHNCKNTKCKSNLNDNAKMRNNEDNSETINYEVVLNALKNYYYTLIMSMARMDINEDFRYENKNKAVEVLKQIINISKVLNLSTKKYEIELNKIEK